MPASTKSRLAMLGNIGEWAVPAAAVALVFVMLVPLPALLLDLLLAFSITASVLVLLSAIQIMRPVQFSVFPTLLLLLTLFRLSLNLASSRRILLHGNEGAAAAGSVIEAFGQFVVGGNYVVGFVLFLALIAIQFMVVSHGAVRTAEVTARFTLDAMPGKQMAIDADLNAGLIDEAEARRRREAVAQEAEFYGAMDGAARFNQRDALATILITAINIIAGFLIGVFQLDIPFREALKTYTVLTVGDGLVTMIPSLLVSVAGGIVVIRASSKGTLAADLGAQLFGSSRVLWVGATALLALALMPGLPKVSFFLMAGALGLLARFVAKRQAKQESADAAAAASAPKAAVDVLDRVPPLDELSLEVGYALVPLVDPARGGQLLQRVRALRRHLSTQLGFIVPPVHITDNLKLKPREYVVSIRGVEVARWELAEGSLLAINADNSKSKLRGVDTCEPAFGVAAKWIASELQEQALAAGYAVVDHPSILATHLAEIIKKNAHDLLTRQELKRLLDSLTDSHPKLVEELVPKHLSIGEVQRVLQQLLREQVSIRDLGSVLEALAEIAPGTKNPVLMVEAVRQVLGRALVRSLLSPEGELKVVTVAPGIEDELKQVFEATSLPGPGLQPSFVRKVLEGLQRIAGEQVKVATPVVLCSSPARFHLRRLVEPFLPNLVVISPGEIPPAIVVRSLGVVS